MLTKKKEEKEKLKEIKTTRCYLTSGPYGPEVKKVKVTKVKGNADNEALLDFRP